MFLGHYGLALGAKTLALRVSLGTLVLAAQFVDEVWPTLLLSGVEHVRVVPGLMAASPLDFHDYPITHSLLMGVIWSLLVGGIYLLVQRDRRGALVVGALVLSHWGLDFIVHRPDLPLWPGGPLVGLGLWRSQALTLLLELTTFGGGIALYVRKTRALDRIGEIALWALITCLGILYMSALFGPPPPNAKALAWSALVLWLFIPWAYWIDRHRVVRTPSH